MESGTTWQRVCDEFVDGAHRHPRCGRRDRGVEGHQRRHSARLSAIDPARVHVIYNGIDLNEYQKTTETSALTKYGVDPSTPYVLFVGRITRQKGVTHLVDAIRYMPPDTQVVLMRRRSRHARNRGGNAR